MFTQDNTEGYSDSELDDLNDELETRLLGITDQSERNEIEKCFSDEVSRR